VSDASAEAENLTASLRTRGYVVVDVPLTLLLSRVGVQRPAIVLCDIDAAGALDTIERMRDVPGGSKVDVLFFGERERTLAERPDRVARQTSGIFVRPIDLPSLLRKIEGLIGAPRGGSTRPSLLPQGNRVPVLVAATRRPYRYDTRARARNLPDPPQPLAAPRPRSEPPRAFAEPPLFPSGVPADLIADASPQLGGISPDLQALLGRAEQRVLESRGFLLGGERLSPEAELEAVLPSDLLAALDEPLDELDDDDDDEIGTPGTQGSDSSHASRSGAGSRPGGDSAAGTAPGGGANPFAAREATTSGGDRDERDADLEPPSREPLSREEPPSLGRELPRDEAPSTPPQVRVRTGPPSATGLEVTAGTGLGTLPPSRAQREPPLDLPGSTNPPPMAGESAQAVRSELHEPEPESPREASTRPPRPRPELDHGRNELDRGRPDERSRPGPERAPDTPKPKAAPSADVEIPNTLRSGDAIRVLARAVRVRYSGAIAFEDDVGIRRVVLRDGDFVTAAAGIDNEALTAFLAQRGDLPTDVATRLGRKLPQFGRHAGAALIAQGHLRQEDLWPVLRAHAEWLITRIATLDRAVAGLERVVPPRLSSEPSVFGGATGAEVLLEVVRRAVPPADALAWLGGPDTYLGPGEAQSLIAECALGDAELELVRSATSGASVGELLDRAGNQELANVLFTLAELSVLRTRSSARKPAARKRPPPDVIDHEAVRARIRARRALVDEGDYFSLLGVARGATSYDIRRAYTTLRQEFEPSRILTPLTTDLQEDVDVIIDVLDEAYEILRDQVRRERYRRALEEAPEP
jgi:hypothetical protein